MLRLASLASPNTLRGPLPQDLCSCGSFRLECFLDSDASRPRLYPAVPIPSFVLSCFLLGIYHYLTTLYLFTLFIVCLTH